MQRWQFAVQPRRGFLRRGNRGTRMDVINLLGAQVANSYYPLPPRTNLASTTVPRNQLPRPYPQFSSVTANQNIGYTWYHSASSTPRTRFWKR